MPHLYHHWNWIFRRTSILGLIGFCYLFLVEQSLSHKAFAGTSANLSPPTKSLPISEQNLQPVQVAQVPFPVPTPKPLPTPEPLQQLPPAEDLLKPTAPVTPPDISPDDGSVTVVVKQFKVVGSTVFSDRELAEVLQPFTNRPLTLAELLQARSAITQLYYDAGYITSGAYIPPQDPQDDTITIQVIEGRVTEINVTGNRRLRSSYVRRRLELATDPPLNINELLEKLRLLQLNPLIENVSSELSAGVQPGTSILNVQIVEADNFRLDLFTDNDRSPTVGSWQRGLDLSQANLLGLGDELSIGYTNTAGSNEVNAGYSIPLNARDGTLSFNYSFVDSSVVEDDFEVLDIHSQTHRYEVGFRQPIIQTPTEELALSLTLSRQENRSEFLEDLLGEAIPFPALGADEDGEINVTALRFAQEWTKQGRREVLALRSQFNLGLDLLDPTISDDGPDSRFFSWLGQAQWVRLLAPDTLLLLRSELQLTGDSLLPLEQYGLGGQRTVRGYRKDLLLTDNAFLATAEVRLPIYRNRQIDGLLQGIAFIDVGQAWNVDLPDPDPSTLVGIGVGLLWRMGDRFTARLDWGIPLVDANVDEDTLQESGIYFSVRYTAF
jgi:hemolysin activation/secretion protein